MFGPGRMTYIAKMEHGKTEHGEEASPESSSTEQAVPLRGSRIFSVQSSGLVREGGLDMQANPPKVTVPEIQRMKAAGQKITALTAYDYPFTRILDSCGIDVLLVGDSLSTVVQGL